MSSRLNRRFYRLTTNPEKIIRHYDSINKLNFHLDGNLNTAFDFNSTMNLNIYKFDGPWITQDSETFWSERNE